ncbi:MAG: hypothetical protein BM564_00405 [Bacteroidetes bacterium MedPE-SWsnd-G2]|nr:MAG: hypothetical protein BM564_00405 [Bacteroidetes bacterium MedPE-SWsnd-G2]
MKQLFILVAVILFSSCSSDKHNFTLNGNIKGLKKGTVYLQRQVDTNIVTIDSLEINGESKFKLGANLDYPEVLYLRLDKHDNDEGALVFFADQGSTEINTTLKNFVFDATIKGSKQQAKLDEYLIMMAKFNNKNLDLIKENFEALKENDSAKVEYINKQYDGLLKRKYFYTINFAVNNKDSEVAPYLALSEIPNTSIKYLDTIYKSLTPKIKSSHYGKTLLETIEERKNNSN